MQTLDSAWKAEKKSEENRNRGERNEGSEEEAGTSRNRDEDELLVQNNPSNAGLTKEGEETEEKESSVTPKHNN